MALSINSDSLTAICVTVSSNLANTQTHTNKITWIHVIVLNSVPCITKTFTAVSSTLALELKKAGALSLSCLKFIKKTLDAIFMPIY